MSEMSRRSGFAAQRLGKGHSSPFPQAADCFGTYAALRALICLLWYLQRLQPIETRKSSILTEFRLLRTIRRYCRSCFTIPKTPSAWIDRFIRRSAPWVLFRFSSTSRCMAVSSRFIRTVWFPSPFLHRSAYGQPHFALIVEKARIVPHFLLCKANEVRGMLQLQKRKE